MPTDEPISRHRKDEILSDVHRRIVTGEWAPASRLPTRRQLAIKYDASPTLVSEVLGDLSRDRFIEGRGKLGTFVTNRPPHLAKYAIVFAHRPNNGSFNNFWLALSREAVSFEVE